MKLKTLPKARRSNGDRHYVMETPVLHWCHIKESTFRRLHKGKPPGVLYSEPLEPNSAGSVLMLGSVDFNAYPEVRNIERILTLKGYNSVRFADTGEIYDDLPQFSGDKPATI